MNYEQLLDEIMVNTLSAKQLIGYPQKDFHYAVCPRTLEFHTTIFLSSALLALDQEKPLIILIQTEELPENAMIYTGEIGPHFGRKWNDKKEEFNKLNKYNIPETSQQYYPYLDKLFCYLSVINVNEKHLVLFIKKGEKNQNVKNFIKELLSKDYSLLVISNCYTGLPTETCKNKAEKLISHLKNKEMDDEEEKEFSALNILSEILPDKNNPNMIEQLINSGEIGFNKESSTSLRFMMS